MLQIAKTEADLFRLFTHSRQQIIWDNHKREPSIKTSKDDYFVKGKKRTPIDSTLSSLIKSLMEKNPLWKTNEGFDVNKFVEYFNNNLLKCYSACIEDTELLCLMIKILADNNPDWKTNNIEQKWNNQDVNEHFNRINFNDLELKNEVQKFLNDKQLVDLLKNALVGFIKKNPHYKKATKANFTYWFEEILSNKYRQLKLVPTNTQKGYLCLKLYLDVPRLEAIKKRFNHKSHQYVTGSTHAERLDNYNDITLKEVEYISRLIFHLKNYNRDRGSLATYMEPRFQGVMGDQEKTINEWRLLCNFSYINIQSQRSIRNHADKLEKALLTFGVNQQYTRLYRFIWEKVFLPEYYHYRQNYHQNLNQESNEYPEPSSEFYQEVAKSVSNNWERENNQKIEITGQNMEEWMETCIEALRYQASQDNNRIPQSQIDSLDININAGDNEIKLIDTIEDPNSEIDIESIDVEKIIDDQKQVVIEEIEETIQQIIESIRSEIPLHLRYSALFLTCQSTFAPFRQQEMSELLLLTPEGLREIEVLHKDLQKLKQSQGADENIEKQKNKLKRSKSTITTRISRLNKVFETLSQSDIVNNLVNDYLSEDTREKFQKYLDDLLALSKEYRTVIGGIQENKTNKTEIDKKYQAIKYAPTLLNILTKFLTKNLNKKLKLNSKEKKLEAIGDNIEFIQLHKTEIVVIFIKELMAKKLIQEYANQQIQQLFQDSLKELTADQKTVIKQKYMNKIDEASLQKAYSQRQSSREEICTSLIDAIECLTDKITKKLEQKYYINIHPENSEFGENLQIIREIEQKNRVNILSEEIDFTANIAEIRDVWLNDKRHLLQIEI